MAYGTLKSDVMQSSTAGTPPQFNDGSGTQVGTLCRAWVNFNGTTSPGTIRGSFNVGSVTKNGTGDYTVNFTNSLNDANYSTLGTSGNGNTNLGAVCQPFALSAPSTSSVRIQTPYANGFLGDNQTVSIAIFR